MCNHRAVSLFLTPSDNSQQQQPQTTTTSLSMTPSSTHSPQERSKPLSSSSSSYQNQTTNTYDQSQMTLDNYGQERRRNEHEFEPSSGRFGAGVANRTSSDSLIPDRARHSSRSDEFADNSSRSWRTAGQRDESSLQPSENESVARRSRREAVNQDINQMRKISTTAVTANNQYSNSSSNSSFAADPSSSASFDRGRQTSRQIIQKHDLDSKDRSAALAAVVTAAGSSRKLSSAAAHAAAAATEVYKDVDGPALTYRRISAWDNKYEVKYSADKQLEQQREHTAKGISQSLRQYFLFFLCFFSKYSKAIFLDHYSTYLSYIAIITIDINISISAK